MSAQVDVRDHELADIVERNIDLAFACARAILADASLLDGIPNGVTLVLLPEEDRDLTEQNLQGGLRAIRAGKDVLFRHVRLADLPPPPELSPEALRFLDEVGGKS